VPSDLMGVLYLQVQGPALTPEDKTRIMVSLERLLKSERAS
jgi:hypothetical protein